MLREAYMLAAINLKIKDKNPFRGQRPHKFKAGDLVFLKNHEKQTWNMKYIHHFHISKVINDRANDL